MLFKKALWFGMVIIIGACSWRPVYYQDKGEAYVDTATVQVVPMPEQSGRILTQKLNNLLNPQKVDVAKEYVLDIQLQETLDTDQGILGDNTATRATMRIRAGFQLKRKSDDKKVLDSFTFASSSYNILMLPYPTVTAESATRKRLLEVLAGQIATRVAVYFQNQESADEN